MKHDELQLQEYLQPQNVVDNQLAKFMFAARTRILDVRKNYKNRYTQTEVKCPFKCNSEDSLECEEIETVKCVLKNMICNVFSEKIYVYIIEVFIELISEKPHK